MIRLLLKNIIKALQKTLYTNISPKELSRILQRHLISDGIIQSKSDKVVIELLPESIYVNDQKLESVLGDKYRSILKDHSITSDKDGIHVITPITILFGSLSPRHEIQYKNDISNEPFVDDKDDFIPETSNFDSFKKILSDKKTILTYRHRSQSNKWPWSSTQDELIQILRQKTSHKNANRLNMAVHGDKVYLNGEELSDEVNISIKNLFEANDIPSIEGFRFVKHNNHIILLGPVLDLDQIKKDIIKYSTENGWITSKNEEVILELSPDQFKLNQSIISGNLRNAINNILQQHYIIPAPGKIIQINTSKNVAMHVGYHVDSNFVGAMELK